jgi:protein tyrosine phosphatase (PTP) superfamily phosphohydrolase (DUF442 family)
VSQSQLPVFLITGTPGSGKSATAAALMLRFPFGLHIPMDDLREWVASGISHPVPEFTEETGRQFRLARAGAAQVAAIYADAGFAVAIDDVIHEPDAEKLVASLAPRPVHKILLQPSLEVALARNAARTNKDFATSALAETIRGVHRSLTEQNRPENGWAVVDNSAMSLEETVDMILEEGLRSIRNYRRLGPDLITSGLPTEAQLSSVAAAGFEVVINLLPGGEPRALPDERGAVERLGMIYEHIPVVWAQPTRADLEQFFELMDKHAGRRLFVHCAANYRASAFILLYRVLRLGWPIEDALPDMRAIWNPAEYPAWQAFIESNLHGV